MKILHSHSFVWISLCSIMLSVGTVSKAQQENDLYQPRVGQAGKDVVWVPTPQVLVDKMLEIAEVTPDDYIIDLGSGDGRTVISAAKLGAKALGVEYNPNMVMLSKKNAAEAGVSDKAEFIEADLFETDLSKATVITMFLLPDINLKLRPKLLALKPGTRIVSNTFTMQEWTADLTVRVDENCTSWCTALMWIVPADVEGTWDMGNDTLDLTQEFQIVSGTLTNGGKSFPVENGRLKGNELTFKVDGALYNGIVNNTNITGSITSNENILKWTAERIKR